MNKSRKNKNKIKIVKLSENPRPVYVAAHLHSEVTL